MPHPPRRLAELLKSLLDDSAHLPRRSRAGKVADEVAPTKLLFLGNPQDPCPRLLLLDARLEPVDIVTWQVIRVHAQAGKAVAFPSYPELMHWVRVSRATIARAVALLRLARWLLLCAAPRDAGGRFAGNAYALVDESLPLAEMLRLDDGYIRFAEQACHHRSVHVRQVAAEVLEEAKLLAESPSPASLSPVVLGNHLAERFERIKALMTPRAPTKLSEAGAAITDSDNDLGIPSLGHGVQNLNAVAAGSEHRVQILNSADRVQNLNSVLATTVGSSSNNKTTTTLKETGSPENECLSLEFPPELTLTHSQQRVLGMRLAGLPPSGRQDVLDEGTARILAKRRTADPVRCEFDYIARLCSLALNGEFTLTDAGARLRDRRGQRAAGERVFERARAQSERRRLEELAAHAARQAEGGQQKS